MKELDRLAENAKRYDSWRGGSRSTAADGERTGADEMRDMMRRQVLTWAAVAVVGIVLIVAGFAVRRPADRRMRVERHGSIEPPFLRTVHTIAARSRLSGQPQCRSSSQKVI